MRLVTYRSPGGLRAGVQAGDGRTFDLAMGSRQAPGQGALPDSLLDLLALEEAGLERARAVLEWAERSGFPAAPATGLAAPLPRPSKLLAVANNYTEHIIEGRAQTFEKHESTPWLFLKPSTAIIGDGEPILLPDLSDKIDWEIELAVVIGRRGRHIAAERAYDFVAGYTLVNDVSARRINVGFARTPRDMDRFHDWLHGKWFDSFAPMGPCVVTRDEVPDPHSLNFALRVSGQVRQQDNTAKMIFQVPEIIEFCARFMTLEPGDVIATGTARGTGSATQTFLKDGELVEAQLDHVGVLRNPVRRDAP